MSGSEHFTSPSASNTEELNYMILFWAIKVISGHFLKITVQEKPFCLIDLQNTKNDGRTLSELNY